MNKPIAWFESCGDVQLGHGALLFGVKHHPDKTLDGSCVRTSRVVSFNRYGGDVTEIVTENTHYVRA